MDLLDKGPRSTTLQNFLVSFAGRRRLQAQEKAESESERFVRQQLKDARV